MIHAYLKRAEENRRPITVGLVGAGCMGYAIALQIAKTPGMQLKWVADLDLERAHKAAQVGASGTSGADACALLVSHPVEVFVEATNTIFPALRYCQKAVEQGAHLVLMNAEVDLTFGSYLKKIAEAKNLVVTSDAGDQHGVLAKMIDEIELWGFRIVQAGNIKGYLDRYATAESLTQEAAKRNLNPIQCCAYTDGTKLNIEMALLSNAFGYLPTRVGMEGPSASRVEEAITLFEHQKAPPEGGIDYLLGAEPGGGVYVIGHCDDPAQAAYLSYYKLGDAPYYLFYRPYHLCHLETPQAIAQAYFCGQAYLQATKGRVCDVYAFAKRDLNEGERIEHGIGGDGFYGQVAICQEADQQGWVPIALLDLGAELREGLQRDEPLRMDQVTFPESDALALYWSQRI